MPMNGTHAHVSNKTFWASRYNEMPRTFEGTGVPGKTITLSGYGGNVSR